jgi:hypothetical protein
MAIVPVKDLGQFGIWADHMPGELAPNAFSGGQNVRFRNGYAERVLGESPAFTTPAVTPYWIQPYVTTTARFWIHAGLAAVYADDGTTRTDITGTAPTGAIDDRWTGGSLNGVLVMNNGVDQPMFWGGDTSLNLATLTGWNSAWRCKSLKPFKNFLLALNVTKSTTNYPHMVKWSDAADPGAVPASWDEADATKLAGEQDIAETPDLIVDGEQLGDIFVVYKERSRWGIQFIGGNDVFRFFRLPGDDGLLARGQVAVTPVGHVFMTAGDVKIHTGGAAQSILDGKMRKYIFSQIDSDVYGRAFLATQPQRSEVWICFPSAGQETCNMAVLWNWETGALGVRDLNAVTYGAAGLLSVTSSSNTWDADSEAWQDDDTAWNQDGTNASDARLLLTTTTPAILIADSSTKFNGTDYTSYVQRSGMDFGDGYTYKTCRGLIPRIDAAAGAVLSIEIGGADSAEESPVWSSPVSYTVGTTFKADAFATGRYLAYRIKSESGQPWRVRSVDFDIVSRGAF